MPENLKIHTYSKGGPYKLNRVFSADSISDSGLGSPTRATKDKSSPQGRLNGRRLFPRKVPLRQSPWRGTTGDAT